MPGPTESPGKSISAPQVMMPPTDQTRDEEHNMSFYCRAGGNIGVRAIFGQGGR